MNLTDDQIRSLRAKAQEGVGMGRRPADWHVSPATVLSLVEEVQRLRHKHVTDPDGTSYCPLSESLAAKAEAGKGLYEALMLLMDLLDANEFPEAAWESGNAALARWEAVENG